MFDIHCDISKFNTVVQITRKIASQLFALVQYCDPGCFFKVTFFFLCLQNLQHHLSILLDDPNDGSISSKFTKFLQEETVEQI